MTKFTLKAGDKITNKLGELTYLGTWFKELPCGQKRRQVDLICHCGNRFTTAWDSIRPQNNPNKRPSYGCGCYQKKAAGDYQLKHGCSRRNNKDPLYHIWAGIIDRTTNPNNSKWHCYGGRGIKISEEWRHDFGAFKKYLGERPTAKHSVDRINNDLGYEPGNVRWATQKEQANNTSSNKRFEYKGEFYTASELADRFSTLPAYLIFQRLTRDRMPIEKALGAKTKTAKFCDEDLQDIRMFKNGGIRTSDIARVYKINPSTVSRIVKRLNNLEVMS